MSNRFPQRPKRKLDPIIYRRRRIFFGSAGLVVILLLWWLVGSIVGAVSNMFNPTPQASISAPVAQAGQPCAPGTVSVTAYIGDENKVSAASFDKGVDPYLWFTVTNIGSVSCTFDAGSAVSFYTITSGSETIWDSSHCESGERVNQVVTLEPQKAVGPNPSTWMRVYSSASGGCSTGQKPVKAGGASYHLTATVGGVISNDVQFVLN